MDEWEKFNETLPKKENSYSNLSIKDIKNSDYNHAKRVCKDFKIKKMNIITCILKAIHCYCMMFFKTLEYVIES